MPDVNLFTYTRFTSVDRGLVRRFYRNHRETMVPSHARAWTMQYIDQLAADCAWVDSFGGE
jgi:hypothetical protein